MSTTVNQVGAPQVPVETKVKNNDKPVQNPPAFKGKTENDKFVKSYQVEATAGKKWGVGLASLWCPGLGQAINGQWGKGVAYLLGFGAMSLGTYVAMAKHKSGMMFATALGALGVGIASIVDAVKNAKSTVRVVDKEGLEAASKEK